MTGYLSFVTNPFLPAKSAEHDQSDTKQSTQQSFSLSLEIRTTDTGHSGEIAVWEKRWLRLCPGFSCP